MTKCIIKVARVVYKVHCNLNDGSILHRKKNYCILYYIQQYSTKQTHKETSATEQQKRRKARDFSSPGASSSVITFSSAEVSYAKLAFFIAVAPMSSVSFPL